MTIKSFTRSDVRTVRDEAEAALQAVAAKYGLTLKPGGSASFTAADAKFTFAFACQAGAGAPAGQPASFARDASLLGLPADCYGKTFTTFKGESYRITGLATRRGKYPVQAARVKDGKAFKFTAQQVLFGLGGAS